MNKEISNNSIDRVHFGEVFGVLPTKVSSGSRSYFESLEFRTEDGTLGTVKLENWTHWGGLTSVREIAPSGPVELRHRKMINESGLVSFEYSYPIKPTILLDIDAEEFGIPPVDFMPDPGVNEEMSQLFDTKMICQLFFRDKTYTAVSYLSALKSGLKSLKSRRAPGNDDKYLYQSVRFERWRNSDNNRDLYYLLFPPETEVLKEIGFVLNPLP
jgi:hypothetical protein